MKKTIKIAFLFVITFMLFSTVCLANDLTLLTQNNENSVASPTTISLINTDLYLADSEDITISDYINGNAFAVGQNVTINGQIDGDLFILAKESLTISSSAKIAGNVFAITKKMEFDGSACDVYAGCSDFKLGSNAYIYRDLKLYSSNDVNFEGKVAKDIYMAATNVTFPEGSKNLIGGNLIYASTNELTIPEDVVMGEIQFKQINIEAPSTSEIIKSYITKFITVIIYAVAVILLIAFMAPNFADKTTYCMSKKPFITALIGILAIIFVPLLAIFLLSTGFLVYISIALLVIYFLVLSITISILGIAIGNYLANKFKEKTRGKFILLSIASVIVLWLLQQVPAIGGYFSLFTVVFGLGIFGYSLFAKPVKE